MDKKLTEFLAKAHEGIMYGSEPYTYHLKMVADLAVKYGCNDPDMLMACWGHDVLEDTPTTPEMLLEAGFTPRAVELIKLVTDEPGKNRKERKAKTYPKIRSDADAVFIKLMDRLANVSANAAEGNSGLMDMYRKEAPEFEAKLKRDGEFEEIWKNLSEGVYK